MGWTLTTAMWRNRNPVTGQARITGTLVPPGISASFNDRDGKPLVFQLNGARKWREAMGALGFYEALEKAGFGDLGIVITSDGKRASLLRMLDELFASGLRDHWVEQLRAADIVAAPINTLGSLKRPRRARQRLCDGDRLSGIRQAAKGPRVAVAFLGDPGQGRDRPETRRGQRRNPR